MSTTHLIAINGDYLANIEKEPHTFAMFVAQLCRRSGCASDAVKEEALAMYGVQYINESMNGVKGAVVRAAVRFVVQPTSEEKQP